MSKLSQLGNNLYRGDISFNIVANQRRWYAASAVLLVIALASLGFRGLNFGVEFTGGSVFTVPSETCTVETARTAVADAGVTTEIPIITEVNGASGRDIRVQTVSLGNERSATVAESLATACDTPLDDVSVTVIGPSWGQSITKKALTGLVVFLALVVLYLSVAFEWRMAIAALVALAHDVIITIGIYSLVGFEVTPASVIGVLTILGYSLYDTVVVFDKVKENTRGLTAGSRMTYSEAANLAVNQTLVRSINTSIVGLLPVAALLFVGAYVLGAGTLKDLALALFVGIAVGTYSSVFIATPVLADLKEREPTMKALHARVTARRASRGDGSGSAAGSQDADGSSGGAVSVGATPKGTSAARGPRNQPKRRAPAKRRSGGKK